MSSARAIKLSHSSLSMYDECPLKYKFKYIDKQPQAAKHFFSFGKSVHSALEFMYEGEACPPEDDVLEALTRNWINEAYVDNAAERKAFRDAEKFVSAYYKKFAPWWVKPLAVELKFDITINHVKVTGFVDRIDIEGDELHIIDYKTGQSLDVDRIETDEQLTMYQLAVEELNLGKVVKLSLDHVNTQTRHSSGRHSADLVNALKEKIVRTANAIKAEQFDMKPSEKSCAWCDYKPLCPAWLTPAS